MLGLQGGGQRLHDPGGLDRHVHEPPQVSDQVERFPAQACQPLGSSVMPDPLSCFQRRLSMAHWRGERPETVYSWASGGMPTRHRPLMMNILRSAGGKPDAFPEERHPDHEGPATPVRDPRHGYPGRPPRDRQAHPDPAQTTAILIASPSNRTRFAALAAGMLPDLHTVDPATRAAPRFRS